MGCAMEVGPEEAPSEFGGRSGAAAGAASCSLSEADCVMSHWRAEKVAGSCSCSRTTPEGLRLLLCCSTSATAACKVATAAGRDVCMASTLC